MNGTKPICNVCRQQIRTVDHPNNPGCKDDYAYLTTENCPAHTPISHEALCLRLAELDHLLGIFWDAFMIFLDTPNPPPEVPQ